VIIDSKMVGHAGTRRLFGEIALLDGGPRTETVIADTDLLDQVMRQQEFAALLMDVQEVTRGILRGVAGRLRVAAASLALDPKAEALRHQGGTHVN
jgi:CRP-like cAMP-binding protein